MSTFPFINEPVTNKGRIGLDTQVFEQLNVSRRNYFWLDEQHCKLEWPLSVYFSHINHTISQMFSQTAYHGPKSCATWPRKQGLERLKFRKIKDRKIMTFQLNIFNFQI